MSVTSLLARSDLGLAKQHARYSQRQQKHANKKGTFHGNTPCLRKVGLKVDSEGAGLGPAALGNTLLRRAAESLAQCDVFVNWNEAGMKLVGMKLVSQHPSLFRCCQFK